LRDIPTSIYALKLLRSGQMSALPPWLRHCSVFKTESYLLQVVHTAKYTEDEQSYKSYKNCHIDIYFKTKTVVAHAAKCWTLCHIFTSIQFTRTQLYR